MTRSPSSWFRYASPAAFYPLAGRLVVVFGWLAGLLALVISAVSIAILLLSNRLFGQR